MKRWSSVAMITAVTLLSCSRSAQDVFDDAAEAIVRT